MPPRGAARAALIAGLLSASGCISAAGGAELEAIHVVSSVPAGSAHAAAAAAAADGSAAAPFASLSAARDAIRLRRLLGGENLAAPRAQLVVVHGGTHRLTEPLSLGPLDANTRWTAQDGPPSRLSGGVVVGEAAGWTQVPTAGDRTWRAALPEIFRQPGEQPPSSLWVGEQRYQLARIPAPSVDARRVGEYNALHWHMPLDPLNDTALENKHGVVVNTSLLPPSLFEKHQPRNRYLTFFHSYDTSFVRIANATVLEPSYDCFGGQCIRVVRGNHSDATCGGVCTARPDVRGWCCWNREEQGCNSSAACDAGGEGCVPSGAITKKYGKVHCDTCASRHQCFDCKTSSCVKCTGVQDIEEEDDDDVRQAQPRQAPAANLTAIYFTDDSETSEYIGQYQSDSNRRFYISNVPEALALPEAVNQFEVDLKAGTITIVTAPGVDPTKEEVIAGRLISVVTLSNTRNISWHGFRMHHSDWQGQHSGAWPANDGSGANASGLVEVHDSTDISLVSCELAHIGGWALGVTGASRFVSLSQSHVFDSAIGGVYFDGCGADGDLRFGGNHTLTHNRLMSGGHVIPQGVGIHISCFANIVSIYSSILITAFLITA